MRKWVVIAAMLIGALLLAPQASATLGSATNFGTGGQPLDVAIADMDGDGKQDLVSGNNSGQGVSVLLGNGAGSFAAKKDFSGGGSPNSIAVGDLNGDARPDVAAARGDGVVAVLLGLGGGDLGTPTTFAAGAGPRMVAMADVDNDGDSDLAVTNGNPTYGVSLLLGNGDGTFAARTAFPTPDHASALVFGNFNAGGNLDLAVTQITAVMNGDKVAVMFGNGHGQFGAPTYYPVGQTPTGVATGDLDQDGDQDLAVANVNGSFDNAAASVLLGAGDGTFGPTSNFTFGGNSPGVGSVAIGDLTNDGDPDLVFSAQRNYPPSSIFVIPGNGDGTFGTPIPYPVGNQAVRVTIGKLNADSNPDVAVANYNSNNVSVLLNRAPVAAASPASVNFPGQAVGTTSSPQVIEIVNQSGGDPMNVGQLEVSGPDASSFTLTSDECTAATMPFGGQCEVKVVFQPSSTGSRTATLNVPYNGLDSPLEVPLGGQGIDVIPPDTTIDSGPTGTIATASPTFTFHGTAGDTAKLMCKLDQGDFADCVSPATFSNLADGPHTVTIRAEDSSGNQDPTPASRDFTVDATPPDTVIDSGPSGTISTGSATFSFHGDPEGDTDGFMCKLDSAAFAECSSPVSYTSQTDGLHVFTVRAVDQAGNYDLTPPSRDFTVDTTAPDTVIDSGPSGTIDINSATFAFHGSPAGDTAKLMCKVDAGDFQECFSPFALSSLSEGPHTAVFRAEDSLGNRDLTPAVANFTVDTVVEPLPKATIGALKFTGPAKARKRRKVPFTIRIPNTGDATATGVKLTVSGKGVSFRKTVGQIAADSARVLKVKLRFGKTGKVKATLRVTSTDAGTKTTRKTIRVGK